MMTEITCSCFRHLGDVPERWEKKNKSLELSKVNDNEWENEQGDLVSLHSNCR